MPLELSNDYSIYGDDGPPPSLHVLSHGGLDYCDLVPILLPHHIPSEVGFGDTHSTFSNPDTFATSNFRSSATVPPVLTNLSDIFEYGVVGTGLGLPGIHAPDLHSL